MPALLSRLGAFSARHRIAVVVAWILALVLLAVVTVTGMKFSDGGFDVPGTDSSDAMKALDEEFASTDDSGPTLQLVLSSGNGQITDEAARIAEARESLTALPNVASVSDPLDPAQPRISPDLTTAIVEVTFDELSEHEAEAAAEDVAAVADDVRADGLVAEVGGTVSSEIPEILGPSELVGAIIAFLVLMVTFGSLVAAGANMLGALIGVGVGVLGVLGASAISPIGSVTPILAVMLGLAVGIDYGLFVLSRFRSELTNGRSVPEAIALASGTAGSAVAFAGATVVIALVGLTVVGIPFLGEMGLAAAVAVVIAVLMSLTLMPALMSMIGRRALPRRARSRRSGFADDAAQGPSWAARWGAGVTRRPLLAIAGTVLALGVAAVPVASMQTSLVIPGGEDPASSQRAAYDVVADKFGDGAQDPLVVLVRAEDAATAAQTTADSIGGLDDVAAVIPSGVSESGAAALLTVIAESGPLDDATKALVSDIRDLSTDDATVQVTGSTALSLDSDEQLRNALVLYIALIVGLSLLLLIVLFRSILVPLLATVGFLLSLGAGLCRNAASPMCSWSVGHWPV